MKLNGQCYFPGRPENLIVCQHIAAQYINDIYQNVDYKPHQDDYFSAQNFSRTSTKNAKTRLWRWFPAVLRGVALCLR
ncbi:ShET2/EspL2 family type III secretion system effector toxin [Shigella flexneri]